MSAQAETLRLAAARFREYEAHHRDKLGATPPHAGTRRELEAKVDRNREMAEICEAALATHDARAEKAAVRLCRLAVDLEIVIAALRDLRADMLRDDGE